MNLLIVVALPLFIIALLIRTLVFQPFNTPSMSMAPTLVAGDKFFVSKSAYGYSRYSFPLAPVFFQPGKRTFGAQPAYGDVVVFRPLKDPATDYIKRVVGLPGDRVQMKSGQLYINGRAVERDLMVLNEACGGVSGKRWREHLPNGVTYETLDCVANGFTDNTPEYRVPDGHYFVMGDNRDNSNDSRMLSTIGYVPYENLVGRYVLKYLRGKGEE